MAEFKLTKEQEEKRGDLIARLQEASDEVDQAVSDFNETLIDAREGVDSAVAAYNVILKDVRRFTEDMATQAEEAIEEKSDKWKESDRGHAASEWLYEWANIDLEDAEIDFPEELSWDNPGHADELEGIAEDPLEGLEAA